MNFVLDASVTLACTFEQTHLLARRHNLSAYNAHYLELAIRYGIPLATLDEGLRQAAGEEGVKGPLNQALPCEH
jgi:predicted nucleic acid-binding protein